MKIGIMFSTLLFICFKLAVSGAELVTTDQNSGTGHDVFRIQPTWNPERLPVVVREMPLSVSQGKYDVNDTDWEIRKFYSTGLDPQLRALDFTYQIVKKIKELTSHSFKPLFSRDACLWDAGNIWVYVLDKHRDPIRADFSRDFFGTEHFKGLTIVSSGYAIPCRDDDFVVFKDQRLYFSGGDVFEFNGFAFSYRDIFTLWQDGILFEGRQLETDCTLTLRLKRRANPLNEDAFMLLRNTVVMDAIEYDLTFIQVHQNGNQLYALVQLLDAEHERSFIGLSVSDNAGENWELLGVFSQGVWPRSLGEMSDGRLFCTVYSREDVQNYLLVFSSDFMNAEVFQFTTNDYVWYEDNEFWVFYTDAPLEIQLLHGKFEQGVFNFSEYTGHK